MEKICGIYTITNLTNNKKYVGESYDIHYRWKKHKYHLRKGNHGNILLQNSWNKCGEDNFKFEIFLQCNKDLLLIEESRIANELDTHNRNKGYNIFPAGQRITKQEYTQEFRDAISKRLTGKKRPGLWTEESKARLSKATKGKNHNHYSEEGKIKILEGLKKYSQKGKDHPTAKPIYQYSLDLQLIKEWDSTAIASRELNINCKAISNCLNKNPRYKTVKGFIWEHNIIN